MTQAMVSAAQPEAAETGAEILRAGGNAIDAMIGAALVQTAVDPQMCGIAGMGSMQVYMPARGIHTTLDFHGRAPAAVRPCWRYGRGPAAPISCGCILLARAIRFLVILNMDCMSVMMRQARGAQD